MNTKQRKILSLLIKNNGQKFSELQKNFKEADKFPYHLAYLQKRLYLNKKVNKYYISNKGAHQFRYFDALTLSDVEEKLPTLVLVCKIGNKFLLKKSANGSYGLWPIRLLMGLTTDEIIQSKMNEYGFKGTAKYRCAQNMIVKENKELVYDNVWMVFDVAVESYNSTADNFKSFTLQEIKNFKKTDELTDEFVIKNNRTPFSTKIIAL